jgi:hypothetical protein
MKIPLLLLTSAVTISDAQPVLNKKSDRIELTLYSIREWLILEPEIKIVICDGSNFDFSPLISDMFPLANIECLYFKNSSHLVSQFGKGFGEGEIIKYALANSRYLSESEFFAKCTSKLWVKNFRSCLAEWNGSFICDGDFSNVTKFKPYVFNHIDTRFYFSTKIFYAENFLDAYQNVNDKEGQSLEQCFKNVAIHKQFRHFIFPIRPEIAGVSGSTGEWANMNSMARMKDKVKRILMAYRSDLISTK